VSDGSPEVQRQLHRPEPSVPILLFFYSRTSGHCRRVDGFLAQVLQRGRNHAAFRLHRVERDAHPDLFEKFGIEEPPALVVIDKEGMRARLERPRGCAEIAKTLAPWLRQTESKGPEEAASL
jgi:thioredoxin family protein